MVGIGWSCGYPARAALEASCCTSDPVLFTGSEDEGPSRRARFVASELNEGMRSALFLRAPWGALPALCLAMAPDMFRRLELADGSLVPGSAGRDPDVGSSLCGSSTPTFGERSPADPLGSVCDGVEGRLGDAACAGWLVDLVRLFRGDAGSEGCWLAWDDRWL